MVCLEQEVETEVLTVNLPRKVVTQAPLVITPNRKELTKIVAACLFGDAHVTACKNKENSGFELGQTSEHLDHLDYIADRLSHITSIRYDVRAGVKTATKTIKPTIRIRSRHHPFYTNFRERMYPIGRKVIDPHHLTLLDAEFLAIWFVQDGWHSGSFRKNTFRHEIALSTESFCYAEQMLLRSALKEKFNLDWNVKQYRSKVGSLLYYLQLSTKDVDRMLDIVTPFVQPSFTYKVDKTIVYSRLKERKALRETAAREAVNTRDNHTAC